MLETVGFDSSTHDVYRAMLLHPDWTFGELARQTGLSDDQVRSALDRLTELSLLHEATDHGFVPVSPEVGLLPLLQRLEAELDEQRARLSRDRAALTTLTSAYTARAALLSEGGVERLTGPGTVRARLGELVQQATEEVYVVAPDAGAPGTEACDPALPARGVRVRAVHLDTAAAGPGGPPDFPGGEIRTAPVLPLWLTVYDRSVAVVATDPDDPLRGALLIRHPSLVGALVELFHLVWESSRPLSARSVAATAAPGEGPSERELTLLRLLEAGLTDEGIGRKMGVSLRTVRRNMSDLFKHLGAQSRFQAGAEAVRRGWL